MELPMEYRSFQDPKIQRRRALANAAEAALGPPPLRPRQPWDESWEKTLEHLGVRRVGSAYEFFR
jgi:hypothetical protein